jgi:hypothetical protein
MILINEGTINATGSNVLDIDTGSNDVFNSGILESTGSGGLIIRGNIENSGTLWANGGNMTVGGNVNGNGSGLISGSATLEFGGASSAKIAFDAGATGILMLDHASDFAGTVSGFGQGDILDLVDILFANNASLSYAANQEGTGGILQVTDGNHTANITLLGQYDPSNFISASDGASGTMVVYDPTHHTT